MSKPCFSGSSSSFAFGNRPIKCCKCGVKYSLKKVIEEAERNNHKQLICPTCKKDIGTLNN